MCILSRCAPPLRSAPCRSAPTASRLLCVLAALLAALASPVVQSQDFKKEVIDVPDPETLFRRLASVPGYDTPARQRDVAQEMNLLLGRMVNEEHLREGFGQPLRFSTDQRERLRQLALAYSGEVLRLNEQLTPKERASRTLPSHAIRALLVSQHFPLYERVYPGSVAEYRAGTVRDVAPQPGRSPPRGPAATASSPESGTPAEPAEPPFLDATTLDLLQTISSFAIVILILVSLWVVLDRGFSFEFRFVPVTVMKESQRSETKVHGNVSGDGATQYAGGRVHGTITSTVTRYQEICVQSADGDETVIELVNEKLPCREGHDIAIVQLRRVGGSFDTVAFHNENTGETLFRDRAARDAIRGYPKRLPVFLLLFSSFVAGLVFTAGDAPSPGVMAKSGALPGLIFFVILMVIQEGLIRFRASLRLPGIGRALRAKLEARRAG